MIILAVIGVFAVLMGIIGWKKGIFGFVSGLIAVVLAVLLTWGLKPFVKEWLWDENGEVEDVVEFYNLRGQTV